MDVDSQGLVYIGQTRCGRSNPKSARRSDDPRAEPQAAAGPATRNVRRAPAVAAWSDRTFPAQGGAAPTLTPPHRACCGGVQGQVLPPTTPMMVGQIEEIRLDEPAGEMYVVDSYLGGRVMVFDLNTFAFKRGWGTYGQPLNQISTQRRRPRLHANGPMPKDFAAT